jgi:lipopolysaccharide cholinephosphotransferase
MKNIHTKPKVIKDLYRLMYHIHNIFVKHGILYFIEGGTLLGAVRHKGIIPWDDDIDLEVGHNDIPKILSAEVRQSFKKVGCKVLNLQNTLGWVKISLNNVQADIFPVYISKSAGGIRRTYWDFEIGRREWPKCYLKYTDIFPLKEYQFGALKVLGPKNPRPMLNRCYGRSWSERGYITQDTEHNLLETPILVQKGNFKPAKNFYIPPPTKPQLKIPQKSLYIQGEASSFFKI